jgi:hypothetical protein
MMVRSDRYGRTRYGLRRGAKANAPVVVASAKRVADEISKVEATLGIQSSTVADDEKMELFNSVMKHVVEPLNLDAPVAEPAPADEVAPEEEDTGGLPAHLLQDGIPALDSTHIIGQAAEDIAVTEDKDAD